MRRLFAVLTILALLALPYAAVAQQASPGAAVTQTGSTGLAGTCAQATGTNSAQQTITIPAPSGSQSVYLDYISASIYGTAAIATSATIPVVTTTGIPGSPSWPFATAGQSTTAAGAVVQAAGLTGPLGIPIKSIASTAVTVVGPAAVATYFQYLTVCYHVAN